MKNTALYLKSNVVIEPLVDRWYAWSHLVSPATAALNLTGRHIKILRSFIQAPQVHAEAVKNPKMLGGPFMDIPVEKADLVKNYLQALLEKKANAIRLADAIRQLHQLLKDKASGYSLNALYQEVPEPLRGYVELVYDLHNRPSFRLFEALLYKSEFYDIGAQSIAIWQTNNDSRPFCLSTPRLGDEGQLHLPIPFNSPIIDRLSRMKRTPDDPAVIREALGLEGKDSELFDSLFTSSPPPAYSHYEGNKVRMRYFGHACILIETASVSVLVDPLISYYGYQHELDRFSDIDLPDHIDYVLITHNHQDHVLFETLLPLRHKIGQVIIPRNNKGKLQDPGLRLLFEQLGFRNCIEIDELESRDFPDCSITSLPFLGEHSDLDIQAKACYHLKIGTFSMLFLADSCNIEPRIYEHVHRQTGDIDVLFLGMECDGAPLTWLYGPLMPETLPRDKDHSRRLAGSDFQKGKALVDLFHPREVYVYAMGMEPWLEFITSVKYTPESNPIVQSDLLIEYCRAADITAERLYGEKEILYDYHSIAEPAAWNPTVTTVSNSAPPPASTRTQPSSAAR